jgi:hypothetical protein
LLLLHVTLELPSFKAFSTQTPPVQVICMSPFTPAIPFGEHASPGLDAAASAGRGANTRQRTNVAALAEIPFMILSGLGFEEVAPMFNPNFLSDQPRPSFRLKYPRRRQKKVCERRKARTP